MSESDRSPWIREVGTSTFEPDVIERSRSVPVVVDFWAPWCGPCRQLTPLLETLVEEQDGRIALAKVNVDEAPDLAGAFGVQSIPFVVAVRDGQPVEQLRGLLPEGELRQWLQRVLPSPVDDLLKRGESLEEQDPAEAESCYRQALEHDPGNDAIRIRLARALVAQNRDEKAREIVEDLQRRGFLEPEAEAVRSQLELRSAAAAAGGLDAARRAVEADPENDQLRLKLADALTGAGQYEEALRLYLETVRRDKAGAGQPAKERMLRLFDLLGPDSDLAGRYRRQLATALY